MYQHYIISRYYIDLNNVISWCIDFSFIGYSTNAISRFGVFKQDRFNVIFNTYLIDSDWFLFKLFKFEWYSESNKLLLILISFKVLPYVLVIWGHNHVTPVVNSRYPFPYSPIKGQNPKWVLNLLINYKYFFKLLLFLQKYNSGGIRVKHRNIIKTLPPSAYVSDP